MPVTCDAIHRLRLGVLHACDGCRRLRLDMPVMLLTGCVWGFLCLCCLSQVAHRLLMPATLLDVALGLLMPMMLFAGCAWAYYYLPVMLFAGCAWASYACARDAIRGCAWASYACDASRRLRLGFVCPCE